MSGCGLAVAIVFFNKAEQTGEAIRSFAGTGAPVYVLNNGSAPQSAALVRTVCEGFSNVRYLHADKNLGCGGGRNVLIKASQEPWLLFVDNDITVRESYWLDNIKAHINHSTGVEAFVPVIHNVWDGSRIVPVHLAVKDGQAVFATLQSDYSNVFPGGGAVVSRALFERLGGYDEELLAFEDFELALRAMRRGQGICVQHIHDINLLHDHRVVKSVVDREAVAVRYDAERVGLAHDKIERIYGVSFDRNYQAWLEQQILEMTTAPGVLRFHKWALSVARLLKRCVQRLLGGG